LLSFRNFIDNWFRHSNALCPFIFALFVIGIGHTVLLNGVKAIFKLKFSSINLLMTIAVVAAFWENTQQLLLYSMF
jgi:hypothetical protein